ALGPRSDPPGALDHDLARLQRLGRTLALHGRDAGLVPPAVRERVPGQARAHRPDDAARARPRGDGLPHLGSSAPGVGLAGAGRPSPGGAARRGLWVGAATGPAVEPHPEVVDGARLYVSAGHDEYWSWGMRDAFDAFVAGGGNAAVLSGNTCFWQVRLDEDH